MPPEGFKSGDSRKWPADRDPPRIEHERSSYVDTIAAAWPDIARDFIILGSTARPRRISVTTRGSTTPMSITSGRSTFKGFPGTDRESPALVSQAMTELKEVYPIDHYLVGGHSQGGFLTYSLLMNFSRIDRRRVSHLGRRDLPVRARRLRR